MSKETQSSIALAGVFAIGLALTLFIVLIAIKGYGYILALLIALVIGAIFGAVLLFAFNRPPGASASETLTHWKNSVVGPAESSDPAGTPAPVTAASVPETAPADAPQPEPEPSPAPDPTPVTEPAAASEPAPESAPEPAPEPEPAFEPAEAESPAPAPAGEGVKPATLEGPRGDTADDLKKIKGVGPKLEQLLHGMGFYHFDQIANWSSEEVAWVDQNLEGFKGRVTRDDWVAQAKLLASGGETDFSRKVGDGDVY
jgi:predicted flap endonuclease-1-like 5' DNA nuclease